GKNVTALLGRGGATITAVRRSPTDARRVRFRPELSLRRLAPAAVDTLLDREEVRGSKDTDRAERLFLSPNDRAANQPRAKRDVSGPKTAPTRVEWNNPPLGRLPEWASFGDGSSILFDPSPDSPGPFTSEISGPPNPAHHSDSSAVRRRRERPS